MFESVAHTFVSILNFCQVLAIAENGVLKISDYDFGVVFSPFNSVDFCYHAI